MTNSQHYPYWTMTGTRKTAWYWVCACQTRNCNPPWIAQCGLCKHHRPQNTSPREVVFKTPDQHKPYRKLYIDVTVGGFPTAYPYTATSNDRVTTTTTAKPSKKEPEITSPWRLVAVQDCTTGTLPVLPPRKQQQEASKDSDGSDESNHGGHQDTGRSSPAYQGELDQLYGQ